MYEKCDEKLFAKITLVQSNMMPSCRHKVFLIEERDAKLLM
jgi:hypothetical protein